MSSAAPSPLVHYAPSGRWSPLAILYALVAAGLLGGLAFVYQWLLKVIPFVYLNFLITLGMALVIGVAVGGVMQLGRVRSRGLAVTLGFIVGLVTLLASHWWAYHLMLGDTELGDLTQRVGFGDFIRLRVETGWKLSSLHLGGAWVWILWGIEAVIVVGGGVFGAWAQLAEPYCERCARWATDGEPFVLSRVPDHVVKQLSDARDIGVLLAPEPTGDPSALARLKYTPATCACDPRRGFVDLARELEVVDKKGKAKTETSVLHKAVVLDAEQLAAVEALRASVRKT